MSEWKEVKLGDVCEINPKETLKKGEIYKKIAMEDLIPFTKYIRNFTYEKFTGGSKFKNGDILLARITPSLENGKTSMVNLLDNNEVGFGSTEFIVFREKEGITDKHFLYYLLISNHFRDIAIKSMTGSSGRQRVQKETIENYTFYLPPLQTQKKIADILSVIDEKIETLQNINETLEELAKAIFKSWFVDFDIVKAKTYGKSNSEIAKEFGISEEIVKLFPNEFETSEIGKIPKGWEVSYLGEKNFSEIISSGIKKFQGEKIYLATADVNNTEIINKETTITYDDRPSRANMQPIHKSIWFAKMKDSKKILMFDDYSDVNSFILSTGFAGIKTTDLSHNFLWSFIMTDDFEKQKNNLANGAVQIAINNQNIKKIHFVKPSKLLLQIFNTKTLSIFKTIYFNTQQIQTLQNLRDTLLPKLINGEIEVDELDIKGLE